MMLSKETVRNHHIYFHNFVSRLGLSGRTGGTLERERAKNHEQDEHSGADRMGGNAAIRKREKPCQSRRSSRSQPSCHTVFAHFYVA